MSCCSHSLAMCFLTARSGHRRGRKKVWGPCVRVEGNVYRSGNRIAHAVRCVCLIPQHPWIQWRLVRGQILHWQTNLSRQQAIEPNLTAADVRVATAAAVATAVVVATVAESIGRRETVVVEWSAILNQLVNQNQGESDGSCDPCCDHECSQKQCRPW